MPEFVHLLIHTSKSMGSPLHVANLLQVEPKVVYGWMAGFERPAERELPTLRQRLVTFKPPKPAVGHPRRRAADLRLAA
jgi:hypothetical protein